MTMKLSNSQQKIVDFENGNLLVKAGPGSGKTRVTIERIKKLLRTKKRIKILALTFSNLAAEEMKSRIEEDEDIIDCVANVNIGTIHSFCLELLQKRYSLLGFENEPVIFENDLDRMKILKLIINSNEDWKKLYLSKDNPEKFVSECLNIIGYQKRNFISPEQYDGNPIFQQLYKTYNDYLIAQNAVDFDDILFYAYKIMIENPNVVDLYNKIYDYYFVDEAQDLNYAQYMIIKTLCIKKNNIMMVGDENQSIYGFNGSNSDYMCVEFVNDFNPEVILLYENFRSAKSIVRYANKLEQTDSETNYFYEGELLFNSFDDEESETNYIVEKIKYLLKNGHPDIDHDLDYVDFAIIARNRFSLDKIAEELSKNNMDFYFKKSQAGIILDSELMNVFDLCLRLIINDKDIIHRQQLQKIIGDSDNIKWDSILNKSKYEFIIELLKEIEMKMDFNKALSKIENYVQIQEYEDSEEKEQIINDIELYKKHWNKYARQVAKENRNLSSFKSYIALGKTQDESNNKGIALLTAHMSKGLQYEVVFVIGACEGVFPDYRAIKNGKKEMAQEKNNMFVAVTRAKRICNVSYPRYRKMPWGDIKYQQPSRFIANEKIIKN